MHYRKFLTEHSFPTGNEIRMCVQVLAKHVKGRSRSYLKHLWEYLWANRLALGTPKWCWPEPQKTYAWFGWILKDAERKYNAI